MVSLDNVKSKKVFVVVLLLSLTVLALVFVISHYNSSSLSGITGFAVSPSTLPSSPSSGSGVVVGSSPVMSQNASSLPVRQNHGRSSPGLAVIPSLPPLSADGPPVTSYSTPLWAPKQDKFRGGKNFDWSKRSDIARICNGEAIIEIPGIGSIRWYGCVNGMNANFDRDINITGGVISLDSLLMDKSFNSSAELTMEGVNFSYLPAVYHNGEFCPSPRCQVLGFSGSSITFRVSSFSSYTLGANALLDIWDESDASKPYAGVVKYPSDNVLFFANYTNISSGLPVASASCVINFSDGGFAMVFNATKGLFEYQRSFSSAGAYQFNISCSASGFASLNTSDLSSIHTPLVQLVNSGPSGANFSVGSTSRASSPLPDSLSAFAGNVSEGEVFGKTITQSWQGYVGNVSGTIGLSDGSGFVLYNWSASSPTGEVFASRSFGVNFVNVSCASALFIQNEESEVGQSGSDADSISSTFSLTVHPSFYVGALSIAQDSCYAINLFVDSSSQSSSFFEVLLADNSANIIYTSLLEDDLLGFDNQRYDFEMVVAEDGHGADTSTTPYFFYVELQ